MKKFITVLICFSLFFATVIPSFGETDYSETYNNQINSEATSIDFSNIFDGDTEISPEPTNVVAVGVVLAAVATSIEIGRGLYAAGRHAAIECRYRYGLTPAKYKAHRWVYRIAIARFFTPIVALGFDDYFYGL